MLASDSNLTPQMLDLTASSSPEHQSDVLDPLKALRAPYPPHGSSVLVTMTTMQRSTVGSQPAPDRLLAGPACRP